MNVDNMEEKKIRKRSPNWDQEENYLLKECLKDVIDAIENKSVDTNTNRTKTLAWQRVTRCFNELNVRTRSLLEIKQRWRTMKHEAKKFYSKYNETLKPTGGNLTPIILDPLTIEIMDMVPKEFKEDIHIESDSNFSQVEEEKIAEKNKSLEEEIKGESVFNSNLMEQGKVNDYSLLTTIDYENESANDQVPYDRDDIRSNIKEPGTKKSRMLFKRTHNGHKKTESKERSTVLLNYLKEEFNIKLKHMAEAHEWARKEHELKLEQLRLQNLLIQKQIQGIE